MLPKLTDLIAKITLILRKLPVLAARLKGSAFFKRAEIYFSKNAPKSIANRILALQFAWSIIIYLLFIGALWFTINLVIVNSVQQQGEGWISKLDELGIPVYATNDPTQLNDAISYVRNFPEVLRAQYLDTSGRKITAEYSRKKIPISAFDPLDAPSIEKLRQTELGYKPILFEKGSNSQMRISAPIWIKSISNDGMIAFSLKKNDSEKIETIGFIDIVLDYSHISAALNRNLMYASLIIALMMFVAAYAGRVTVRWALNPLSELEDPLTRLANGETDVTVNSTGDKEIARIGIALNTTISALKERDEALRRMANHDSLTGLVNRKFFVEQLEKEIGRIAQSGGSSALFFFDLDRFKHINDTYGHAAGDRLLIQISNQLSQRKRVIDLVSRFGGDEFTLLVYNVDRSSALEVAESFMQLMREFMFYEAGDMLKIHFSIGITIIDDGTLSSHDYLKEADTAVHEAKTQGRNDFRIFQRRALLHNAPESGVGWHERLQEVLLNNEAIPYYQPLIGLKNQSEHIREVLLRIPDMEHGVLRPGAFMPAAERFGLMAEFDRQMIKKVASVLAVQKNPNLVFSMNLSEQFIEEDNMVEFMKGVITDYHVSPKHFIFELSEQHIIRNINRLKLIIPELSDLDFRFAIDDFGSGFGSFNYIKKFPVHFLKINSSLIERINNDSIDRISVRSIVDIAVDLNMQTIAKYAGDDESIRFLQQLGVDFVQGNFTGKPTSEFKG
ncbi:MAG: EAL domain-containing protein [Gallionellaceae bacterium]|jgi:diguanylate cyclase (GGDEF)-like protein